jgi:transcriptional regulator with XRE-family HTH domain
MLLVGQRIKKIREEKKITQEQLAERLNMSQQSYSSLERGETSINLRKLIEIAEQLDTPPENLIQQEAKNIFKNCTQSGLSVHNPTFHNFPPELTTLYETQIASLKQTIEYQNKLIEQLQK